MTQEEFDNLAYDHVQGVTGKGFTDGDYTTSRDLEHEYKEGIIKGLELASQCANLRELVNLLQTFQTLQTW